jgi:hypothetical protein
VAFSDLGSITACFERFARKDLRKKIMVFEEGLTWVKPPD